MATQGFQRPFSDVQIAARIFLHCASMHFLWVAGGTTGYLLVQAWKKYCSRFFRFLMWDFGLRVSVKNWGLYRNIFRQSTDQSEMVGSVMEHYYRPDKSHLGWTIFKVAVKAVVGVGSHTITFWFFEEDRRSSLQGVSFFFANPKVLSESHECLTTIFSEHFLAIADDNEDHRRNGNCSSFCPQGLVYVAHGSASTELLLPRRSSATSRANKGHYNVWVSARPHTRRRATTSLSNHLFDTLSTSEFMTCHISPLLTPYKLDYTRKFTVFFIQCD